jgi:transcriptional regulator with XRE-family HTH domain
MSEEGAKRVRIHKNLRLEDSANNVRLIRESRGLSQEELSQLSGISQNSISRIENGIRKPRRGTLEKLAKALEVEDPDVLMTDSFGRIVAFEDVLDAPTEQRLGYFEVLRETGGISSFEDSLREHYADNIKRFANHPDYIDAKLEAARMLGYIIGLREGRKHEGNTDGP